MEEDFKDSFTIGTASTGGAIKVYFDSANSEDAEKKIEYAIKLYIAFVEKRKLKKAVQR